MKKVTSITCSPETLKLAKKVRSFREFEKGVSSSLDATLNTLLREELARIDKLFKDKEDSK